MSQSHDNNHPIIRKVSFLLIESEATPQINEFFRFTSNYPQLYISAGDKIFEVSIRGSPNGKTVVSALVLELKESIQISPKNVNPLINDKSITTPLCLL